MDNLITNISISALSAHSALTDNPVLGDFNARSDAAYWHRNGITLKALGWVDVVRVQLSRADTVPALDVEAAIEHALSCRLPGPGKYWHSDDCSVHWVTPKEWLIIVPEGKAQALCKSLENLSVHATDISDSRFTVLVSGLASAELLAQGCALDLHEKIFCVNSSTVTRLAKIPAMITRTDLTCYEVSVDRSLADYLWSWLRDGRNGLDRVNLKRR
jgi:heterotetrameric sarcosine oxidase gamma subunit